MAAHNDRETIKREWVIAITQLNCARFTISFYAIKWCGYKVDEGGEL